MTTNLDREPWRRYLVLIRPLSTAHPNSIDDRDLASGPHRHTHWCQVLQGLIVPNDRQSGSNLEKRVMSGLVTIRPKLEMPLRARPGNAAWPVTVSAGHSQADRRTIADIPRVL
jgi:hypothetical protein